MCDAIFITYRLSRAGDNGVRCTHQPRGSEILLRQGAILASNCAFSAAGGSSSLAGVRITVADNGCGIKAQHLPHLARACCMAGMGKMVCPVCSGACAGAPVPAESLTEEHDRSQR